MSAGELSGKWALVGGASQGIGAAIAELFAANGARVVLLSRGKEKLEQIKKSLPRSSEHLVFAYDLEDTANLASGLREIMKQTGPIEIVVNNSGGPASGPITEANAGDFEKALKSHIGASQIIMQTVLPGMREKKYGRFINVISTSVKTPLPNLGVINTIRAAMANWSKTLAGEVGPYGITVNNVLPGFTKTPRLKTLAAATAKRDGKTEEQVEAAWLATIPAHRFAEPREIAEAAFFLASPRASYINGTQITVDGGRTGTL